MRPPLRCRIINVTAMVCLISLVATSVSHAQYSHNRKRKTDFYLGVEATMGTKTFSVKSNIPAIDGMKSLEEGLSLGVVAGGKVVLAKIKHGFFKPSAAIAEKINLRNLEINVNAFPLEILRTKNQFFKPYLIVGVDRNQLKFLGNYSLPTSPVPPAPPLTPATPCPCICPGEEEVIPVPSTVAATPSLNEELAEDTVLGTVNAVRGSVGTGLVIHVPGKNKFINFFMEGQYGVPLRRRATSPAFDHTSVTGQLSLSAGLAVGLRR